LTFALVLSSIFFNLNIIQGSQEAAQIIPQEGEMKKTILKKPSEEKQTFQFPSVGL
jgi:hypothetical protein